MVEQLVARSPELKPLAPVVTTPVTTLYQPAPITQIKLPEQYVSFTPSVGSIATQLEPQNLAMQLSMKARNPELKYLTTGMSFVDAALDIPNAVLRSADVDTIQTMIEQKYSSEPTLRADLQDLLVAASGIEEGPKLRIQALTDEGKGYPETDEEKARRWGEYLDKYNPDGAANGDNELIKTYYPGAIPFILQRTVDPHDLAEAIREMTKLRDGEPIAERGPLGQIAGRATGATGLKPFKDHDVPQQKVLLTNLARECVSSGLPPAYTATLIKNLIESDPDHISRADLENVGEERRPRQRGVQ